MIFGLFNDQLGVFKSCNSQPLLRDDKYYSEILIQWSSLFLSITKISTKRIFENEF